MQETGSPSKTGAWDETIIIGDTPRWAWMSSIMQKLVAFGWRLNPRGAIATFTLLVWANAFRAAGETLGILAEDPAPPRRSQRRHRRGSTCTSRWEEARRLAQRCLGCEVFKAKSFQPTIALFEACCAAEGACTSKAPALESVMSSLKLLWRGSQSHVKICRAINHPQVLIEILSGSGSDKLAKALGRKGNLVLAWDMCVGAQYDLTCNKNRRFLIGLFNCQIFWGARFGTSRHSFSRARRGKTPPLHDNY